MATEMKTLSTEIHIWEDTKQTKNTATANIDGILDHLTWDNLQMGSVMGKEFGNQQSTANRSRVNM